MDVNKRSGQAWRQLGAGLTVDVSAFGSYSIIAAAADIKVTLAGDQELPPVKSAGAGASVIVIGADRSWPRLLTRRRR